MGALLRTIIVALIFMGAIFFILSELFKFKQSIFGFNRRLASDIKALRSTIVSRQADLVPLSNEEIKMLSGFLEDQNKTHRLGGHYSTILKSLYSEHLAVIAYKYYNDNARGALVAQLADTEYVFVSKSDSVKVFKNGRHLYNYSNRILKDKNNTRSMLTFQESGSLAIKLISNSHHLATIDLEDSEKEFSKLYSFVDLKSESDTDLCFIAAVLFLFNYN